ncbi:hypothetical protein FNV43_RR11052 [Rhamnella rubrinervis]|uniref:F-box domain-containing protein n=1 Tax=Rhamnella rubrinervis TaxID=2594499 RepID=A0A8K0H5J3_9ROSA|nr:hypothetical protein FNV43_RR11052 [Rhamnella rubrinervis]
MEEDSDFRQWDELIPDALGLIFSKLSLQEILTVIPRVCKSWAKAVVGPYCWQEIDIEEWSNRCRVDLLDRMLRMLITRSSGSLRKLNVRGVHDDLLFSFIAEHAGSLQTLRMPRSMISDSIVEQVAGRFSSITFLDVSYCSTLGSHGLEAIGKNCKLLTGLCRNMHPLDTAGKPLRGDEARAIATTMPKLKHLEMAYHLITTESILEVLSCCPEIEFLDLRGCWSVELEDKFIKDNYPKLKVLGPLVVDYYERHDWDYCSDFSDGSSEYSEWDINGYSDESYAEMWDDGGGLEELELRFYEGVDDDEAGYGWPLSP